MSNTTKVEKFLKKHFKFRLNTVKNRLEYALAGSEQFTIMEDFHFNSIWRQLSKAKIDYGLSTLKALLYSNFSEKYNPFTQYLEQLPLWDGKTDHIANLAGTVETHHPALWNKMLKKWIVGMIGSMDNPQTVNPMVLIFTGKQGIGKSMWAHALVPSSLKDYYYSGTINPNNKDTYIHLSECMLINLDELENLTRTEIGSVKELVTKPGINIRRPYAHFNESMVRYASFIGSVNGKQFLNDTSGSRRFLCFETIKINYQHDVPMDDVYSQALSLFRNGFQFWLDSEEIQELNQSNEEFRVVSREEELLIKYFIPCEDNTSCIRMTATEIILELSDLSGYSIKVSTVIMGKILSVSGFKQIKSNGKAYYTLKRIPNVLFGT